MSTLIKSDYTYYDQSFAEFVKALINTQLKHYASDLFPELETVDEITFNRGLIRAQKVCTTLNCQYTNILKKISYFRQ